MYRREGPLDEATEHQMNAIGYILRALNEMRAANRLTDALALGKQPPKEAA